MAGTAGAMHAADHRYVVLGYVRDKAGEPKAGARVVVERERTGLRYEAASDGEGLYVVIVHLHDEDVSDVLRIAVDGGSARIVARFDPLDPERPRGTRVDFIEGRPWERAELFTETLRRVLG